MSHDSQATKAEKKEVSRVEPTVEVKTRLQKSDVSVLSVMEAHIQVPASHSVRVGNTEIKVLPANIRITQAAGICLSESDLKAMQKFANNSLTTTELDLSVLPHDIRSSSQDWFKDCGWSYNIAQQEGEVNEKGIFQTIIHASYAGLDQRDFIGFQNAPASINVEQLAKSIRDIEAQLTVDIKAIATTKDREHQELFAKSYPIMLGSIRPIQSLVGSIFDKQITVPEMILSQTYSDGIASQTHRFFYEAISSSIQDSSPAIVRNVVFFIAISIASGREVSFDTGSYFDNEYLRRYTKNGPIKFIDASWETKNSVAPEYVEDDQDIGGYCSREYNIVTIYSQHKPSLIHEIGHAAFQMLFDNGGNPYHTNYDKKFAPPLRNAFEIAAIAHKDDLEKEFDAAFKSVIAQVDSRLGVHVFDLRWYSYDGLNLAKNATLTTQPPATEGELSVLEHILKTVFTYEQDSWHAEIATRYIQLHVEDVDQTTIEHYLHPIGEFLKKHALPKIDEEIQKHHEFCSHLQDGTNDEAFSYCLKEIVGTEL